MRGLNLTRRELETVAAKCYRSNAYIGFVYCLAHAPRDSRLSSLRVKDIDDETRADCCGALVVDAALDGAVLLHPDDCGARE